METACAATTPEPDPRRAAPGAPDNMAPRPRHDPAGSRAATGAVPRSRLSGYMRAVLAAALAVVALSGAPRAGTAQAAHANDPIQLKIQSKALHRATAVNVLLPASYGTGHKRYPVLYLLHGYDGSAFDWVYNTDVVALMQNMPLIVVMPEAAIGWYANPADPASKAPRWEDYHIGELIPYIDSHYRTIATRNGRAIAGLSMGGMGAFSYGARHPDLFVAAASFSGALDLHLVSDNLVGTPGAGLWYWSGHNPVDLASNLQGLTLYLASGNGTPGPLDKAGTARDDVEVNIFNQNKHMVAALLQAHVPATVEAYGPGTHTYPYWQRDLHHVLPSIMAAFAHPPAPPSPWRYRTIDATFGLWGYHAERKAGTPGWTILTGVNRQGLSVSGTGQLALTTAPLYHAGGAYTVAGPTGTAHVQADAGGRLHLSLALASTSRHWTITGPS